MKLKILISCSLLLLFITFGCASKRPCGDLCCYKDDKIKPERCKKGEGIVPQATETLFDEYVQRKFEQANIDRTDISEENVLSLSAGGQYGAYGAGLLIGWYRNNKDKMPRFDIVTSVSTGSLLAPYAFLLSGDSLDDLDIEERERQNRIREEIILILSEVYGSGLQNSMVVRGDPEFNILKHKALFDRKPLVKLLDKHLKDEYLVEIANQYDSDSQRLLLIGAASLDTGKFRIFNLGEVAKNYRDAQDQQTKHAHKKLFIDVIMASSAVPVVFPPVFINGEMYIDGGAREYVFFETFKEFITDKYRDMNNLTSQNIEPINTFYMIIHGDYDLKARHVSYDPASIALRSMDIVLDNILRLSVFYNAYLATSINGSPPDCNKDPMQKDQCEKKTDTATYPWDIRVLSATGNRCPASSVQSELFDPVFTKCLYKKGMREGFKEDKSWITDLCTLSALIEQTTHKRVLTPSPDAVPSCNP